MKRLEAIIVATLLALVTSSHAGETPARFPVNDADPAASVPSREERIKSPLDFGYFLLEITDRGTKALEAGDFHTSVKYFQAVVTAAPERSIGHAKLCESYLGLKDTARAIETCRQALGFPGVRVQDYTRFVKLRLADKRPLAEAESSELTSVFDHLREQKVFSVEVLKLECDLALRSGDAPRLSRCSKALLESGDKSPEAFAYAWADAKRNKDKKALRSIAIAAEKAGLPPQALAAMTGKTLLLGRYWVAPMVLWASAAVLGLGALFLLVLGLFRAKVRPDFTPTELAASPPS